MYHGVGHFIPSFKLAKILSKHFDIVYAGVPTFRQHIEGQGFLYRALGTVPFGIGLEEWLNSVQQRKPIWWNTLKDRWNNRLFNLRRDELVRVMNDIQPELLIIDAQQSTDFIVLHDYLVERKIKVALFHAMLPTHLFSHIPPQSSLALPGETKQLRRGHRQVALRKAKQWLPQLLRYFITDKQIIKRNLRSKKIPVVYHAVYASSFNYIVSGLPELIMIPRALEFNEKIPANNQHYLGSCIDYDRVDIGDEKFEQQRDQLYKIIEEKKLRFLYCAFGTMPGPNGLLVITILQKLLEATRDQPYFLLVSAKLDDFPLSKADIFITHGGINSIKESVEAQVPMLVYPVEKKTDHPGNSSRVVYHNIGLRGDILSDTVDGVRQKIERLLTDNAFKTNLLRFKPSEKEKDEEILSLILSFNSLQE